MSQGEYAVVRDPDSGIQVTVGYSVINDRIEYRVGVGGDQIPVPAALLWLQSYRRIAMEICFVESRKVEAQRAYEQAVKISPEDWVGAA